MRRSRGTPPPSRALRRDPPPPPAGELSPKATEGAFGRTLALAAALAGALLLAACDHLREAEAAGPACPRAAAPALPLGCANLANLQAMVADPADLTRGRPMTPASGARLSRAVEDYEQPPANASAAPDKTRETMQ